MDEEVEKPKKEPTCPRCGLRSYSSVCAQCGTPIVLDKNEDDEEDEYLNWRERKR